jgi:C-terminal processing protease CtpA/Prc
MADFGFSHRGVGVRRLTLTNLAAFTLMAGGSGMPSGSAWAQEEKGRDETRDERQSESQRDRDDRDRANDTRRDDEQRGREQPRRFADESDRRFRDQGDDDQYRTRRPPDPRDPSEGAEKQAHLGVSVRAAEEGVQIVDVDRNSPAAQAGVRNGDYLLSIDGREIDDPRQVTQMIGRMQAGDEVSLVVWRNGERHQMQAALAAGEARIDARSQAQRRDRQPSQMPAAWLGVALKQGETEGDEAVPEITLVYPTSPAAIAGLRDGDKIVAADDREFQSATALTEYIKEKSPGDEVTLSVTSEDEEKPQKVKVTLASRSGYVRDSSQRDSNDNDDNNPLYSIPEYAMRMEHDRRMVECQKRMEDLMLDLLQEVQELRAEVKELKSTAHKE